MGWYKKLGFNLHGKITSCNVVVNSLRNPIPRTNHHPLFHTLSSPVCYVTHPRCAPTIQIWYENRQDHRLISSPFVSSVSRRHYCVTNSPVQGYRKWLLNLNNAGYVAANILWTGVVVSASFVWTDYPKTEFVICLIGYVAIDLFRGMETVPFTNRTRWILWSHGMEKVLGNSNFEKEKSLLKEKTLPATHPLSVRVKLIAINIINGMQSVSGKVEENKVWIDIAYASPKPIKHMSWFEKLMATVSLDYDFSFNDDESVDVKWVQNCRKKKAKWTTPTIKHSMAFDWEILLVKDRTKYAGISIIGGKIVISTHFIENNLTSDDEIAAVVGHELAHSLARHSAEKMTMYVRELLLMRIRSLFGLQDNDKAVINEAMLSFTRKLELEADYIGLLLMASAGYDPRAAPVVYRKIGNLNGGDSRLEKSECHFSGEKRARLLADPKVMEEALHMYHDATAKRWD